MTNIPIEIPPGFFMDDTQFSGGPRWIAGYNVRPWQGQMQVIGGWALRSATPFASNCTGILEWKTNAGVGHIAYGCLGNLIVEKASTFYDVSPASMGSTAGWNFDNYGETLIANISGAKIYQWSLNTGVVAAQVTNAPVAVTTILVSNERQLIAFGCNEEISGTFNPRCIRGSNIEDITNWTTTATNNVFEQILDGATSGIVAAAKVGNYIGVWTQTELFIGQFIGDPSQTYKFERVAFNCGAIGRRAVTVVNGRAFWLSPELQFHSWSPGEIPSDIPCPMINYVRAQFATLSASELTDTFACHVAAFDEIWFCYTDFAPTPITYSAAFSLVDGRWFPGYQIQRQAMCQGLSGVIAVDTSKRPINCESGAMGNSGAPLIWQLASSEFYLNDAQKNLMVRRVIPDFKSQTGDITHILQTRDYPQGTETQQTGQTFTTSTIRKDFRASARMFRIQLSGGDVSGTTNTYMRLGKLMYDAVPVGAR